MGSVTRTAKGDWRETKWARSFTSKVFCKHLYSSTNSSGLDRRLAFCEFVHYSFLVLNVVFVLLCFNTKRMPKDTTSRLLKLVDLLFLKGWWRGNIFVVKKTRMNAKLLSAGWFLAHRINCSFLFQFST